MSDSSSTPSVSDSEVIATEAPPSLFEREAAAIRALEQLAADRARAEVETEVTFRKRQEAEEKAFQEAAQKLAAAYKADHDGTQARYASVRKGLVAQYQAEQQAVETEYDEVRKKITARANSAKKSAKKEGEETKWNVLAVFEANKDGVIKRHKQRETDNATMAASLQTLHEDAELPLAVCRRYGLAADAPAPDAAAAPPSEDPTAELQELLKSADEQLIPLAHLRLPRFLAWGQFVWPFIGLALAIGIPLAIFVQPVFIGPIVGVVVAIAAAIGVRIWLNGLARKQVARLGPPFLNSLARAEVLLKQCQDLSKTTLERQKIEIEQKRENDARAGEEKAARLTAEADQRRDADLKAADEKYPAKIKEIQARRDAALKECDEKYPARLKELKDKYDADAKQQQDAHRARKDATRKAYQDAWDALANRWSQGLAHVDATATSVRDECARLFLDWTHLPEDVKHWESPTAVPPALRFGEYDVDLAEVPNGLTRDPRLKDFGPTRHTLPALLPFPTLSSVLVKVNDAGKAEAVPFLQALMLRYLSSIPAGKVRFTIVDPVGLGENFAAFMHLGDYSELLITKRIWTEASQIEQQLVDLTEHMENVIQKYLRSDFKTIEEYNVHAGEVAEPFRILVVANFPTNFNEGAARRLLSIASTGARCGVYVLVSVDSKLPLPSGLQVKDFEPYCVNFEWRGGKFQWKDKDFSRFPLRLDGPPEPEAITRLLHLMGDRAKNANKVEVPFEFIAPKPEDYWTQSSARGLEVALGRAGATKLQYFRVGRGTAQHALVAGKTGSGKSTLLHALITNAALRYSPDELELYLIDFKKGVEFKVYASYELPHAKVIAVESEREFGLSVLQRLDAELKFRGDRFRDLGVQDLNGYRQIPGQPPLPRVMFIVDEFQEFFVEDDKIAQDVGLLLDRMVRQGRAFGMHVFLGSQSLGGAYSLARTTLGQMAIRIALQCSEADSHLILSEENNAARLLTRPGEAIYNDGNGLPEANNFFQVVLLSDTSRDGYLRALQAKTVALGRPPAQQIVFEGNLPAVASKNHLLAQLLDLPEWPEPPKSDSAWLGDAIAIKDPTATVFRPQSGANLLIVGQNDEMSLAIMTMAFISLAAQHAPFDPSNPSVGIRFYLLDGSPADSPNFGVLGKLENVLPHPFRNVAAREVKDVIGELADEVERRQKSTGAGQTPPIYLFIFDIQRFRDLRKAEDDFGSPRGGAVPTSKLFATVLRDGPPLNVHTVIWCDSLNNLNRTFDRQGLREFELRVLYQMSPNDSSTLIDSPAASKLGEARALFFSEEASLMEKFRPYGMPPDDWFDSVRERFARRPRPTPAPITEPPAPVTAAPEPAPVSEPEPETVSIAVEPAEEESEPVDRGNALASFQSSFAPPPAATADELDADPTMAAFYAQFPEYAPAPKVAAPAPTPPKNGNGEAAETENAESSGA